MAELIEKLIRYHVLIYLKKFDQSSSLTFQTSVCKDLSRTGPMVADLPQGSILRRESSPQERLWRRPPENRTKNSTIYSLTIDTLHLYKGYVLQVLLQFDPLFSYSIIIKSKLHVNRQQKYSYVTN